MKETEKLLLDYTMEAKQRALDEKLLAKIDMALQSSQDDILPGRVFPLFELLWKLISCNYT